MRPCLVGIGGAGGNVLKLFLKSQDIPLMGFDLGESLAFGDVKGLWLESALQDAQNQSYFGRLIDGKYPGYLITHDLIGADSATRKWIIDKENYGFDLKAQGFDRRAEYVKGLFEVFEFDSEVKELAKKDFDNDDKPMPGYIWRKGIRPFTTLSGEGGDGNQDSIPEEEVGPRSGPISPIYSMIKRGVASSRNKNNGRLCDSIFFISSLGGGTGTGFINPITSYVRSEERLFPIFALGILTEKGEDARKTPEGQRDLGAIIALYDLMVRRANEGIDGLIMVDNEILLERYKGNLAEVDRAIYKSLKPLLDLRNYPGQKLQDDAPALRRVIWDTDRVDDVKAENENENAIRVDNKLLLPSLLIPCFASSKQFGGDESDLIAKALAPGKEGGQLFPCTPSKAEKAYVFTSGFFSLSRVAESLAKVGIPEGKVMIYPKLGDGGSNDILILLRNPYGGSPGQHKIEGTFEKRIYDIIDEAINYAKDNKTNILGYQGYSDKTIKNLESYFYEESGLLEELKIAMQRLSEGDKPIFQRPLSIFSMSEPKNESEDKASESTDLEKLVRKEFNRFIESEKCKSMLREILRD
jgi:hypothetical protein